MAESGERRLVFDTRGRRKNVIRVVYALLALLMAGSLFLTVGPFSIGELIGNGGSTSASAVLDEQAEKIERRLSKDPQNEQLLLVLTRARINAGNARIPVDPETGLPQTPTPEALEDFDRALGAWNRYLKLADDQPSATVAQMVATTFFGVAERGSTSYSELESSIHTAATAQRVVAEQRPNVGSLSSLAIYEFFDGNFAAGDRAVKQTVARASSKSEAKSIESQLAEYRKNAKKFAKEKKAFAKTQQGKGKEVLENPLGGLDSATP